MNTALPPLFVSHGSPMIALQPGTAGAFLQRLGPVIEQRFGRPRAILAISAHTTTREPVLLAAQRHDTIHDFGGFPQPLYEMRYDAPGAPELARETAGLLARAGIAAHLVDEGGLDHGIWTPLLHMWPQADIPVLPLSLVPFAPPAAQFALGEALAPLAGEGVLILGTGSITHNLRLAFARGRLDGTGEGVPEMPESAAFRTWVHERAVARDWPALFDYRRQAPHAALMHPTDEHWLPFYPPAGAGGREATPVRLHDSLTFGVLGMDAYAFGPQAAALQEALQPESTRAA
jgi:4,5-DOPA dioxygenase extradiol